MQNPPEQKYYEFADTERSSFNLRNQYNDIDISNFEEQNYVNVFRNTILPAIEYYRKPQKRITKKFAIAFLIMLGVLVFVAIFFPDGFKFEYNSADDHTFFENIVALFMFIFSVSFIFFFFFGASAFIDWIGGDRFINPSDIFVMFFKTFRKQPISELKKKFFNSLQIEYHPVYTLYSQINRISEIMTKINPDNEKYVEADDIISLNYKNLPVFIVEFKTIGPNPSNCIFIGTKTNKKVSGETFIRAKGVFSSLQTVSLEDISFSENFSVQSFNQIEARYLLTPTFMNRLLKYKKEHNNCSIDILFSNSISNKENVFICISSQKNYFEMSEQDWKDESKSYQIISEIREILLIVDALKLDQDIGM